MGTPPKAGKHGHHGIHREGEIEGWRRDIEAVRMDPTSQRFRRSGANGRGRETWEKRGAARGGGCKREKRFATEARRAQRKRGENISAADSRRWGIGMG